MSCTFDDGRLCHIFKTYISSGDPNYHGELCTGELLNPPGVRCIWWEDSEADTKFKGDLKKFYDEVAAGKKHTKEAEEHVGRRRQAWNE